MKEKLDELVGKWVSVVIIHGSITIRISEELTYHKTFEKYVISGRDYFIAFEEDDVKPDNDFEGNNITLRMLRTASY